MDNTTSAKAVAKTLVSAGFQRFNGSVGFKAFFDKRERAVVVIDIHFGSTNNAAEELKKAGFNAYQQNREVTFIY